MLQVSIGARRRALHPLLVPLVALLALAAGLMAPPVHGQAMKAAEHDQAQGAILGKAMTPLQDGTGMVLVLVTLQ